MVRTIKQKISKIAIFVEYIVLPLVFLFLALDELQSCVRTFPYLIKSINDVSSIWKLGVNSPILKILWDSTLLLFDTLIFILLIRRGRNYTEPPEKLAELLVPLLATFWFATYNFVHLLPASFQSVVIPPLIMPYVVYFGFLLSILGYSISGLAAFHLLDSFGIVVMVQEVKTAGLYNYVRHPIYAGYLISSVGMMLTYPVAGNWLLLTGGIVLTIYRAILEERKLAEYSPQYREYMRRTPFIMPRLFKK